MPAVTTVNLGRIGPVAVLEMTCPESGNALEARLVADLTAAVAAAPDSGARALVLAGAGKHFCSGANLRELAELNAESLEARLADAERLAALYAAILRSPLVTVAAVQGAAYGGGCGLAGACDLVIAGPQARFQFSEVRLGFVPALISVFLPRRLPVARLARLFLDPAPLDAAAAMAEGLVDELADDPRARAIERAAEIAGKTAPSAIAATKRLQLALALPTLDEQLTLAAHVNAQQRAHPDCRRGVASLLAGEGFPSWADADPDTTP